MTPRPEHLGSATAALPEDMRGDLDAVGECAGNIAMARGGTGDASREWQAFDDALVCIGDDLTNFALENERLREALRDIREAAGNSDAIAGCFRIITLVRAALRPSEKASDPEWPDLPQEC